MTRLSVAVVLLSFILLVCSSTAFHCDDGAVVLTEEAVEDDYCDCADGSDELTTAACGVGVFRCTEGGFPDTVSTALVADGVCDCCECSDEPVETGGKPPSSTVDCSALIDKRRLDLQNELAVVQKGMDLARDIRPTRQEEKALKANIKHRAQAARDDGKTAKSQFEKARRKFEANKSQRTYDAFQRARNALGYHMFQADQVSMLDRLDWGPKNLLLPLLVLPCIRSDALNDKIVRGGSTTVVPKLYQYEVCLFRNVTQREYNPSAWEALESAAMESAVVKGSGDVSKDGDAFAEPPLRVPAHVVDMSGDVGSSTSLGMFVGWATETGERGVRSALSTDNTDASGGFGRAKLPRGWASGARPSGDGGPVLRFTYGDRCGNSPDPRQVAVRLVCGTDTAVVSVAEDGMCLYDITVSTPFACHSQVLKALREAGKDLLLTSESD